MDRHGVDHARGGFLCGLGYDGSLQQADKFHWFQGRGIWVFSYLYNHFRQEPRYLEIARKAKDLMLGHGRQTDGRWAELFSREGKILQPFRGDIGGQLFLAEGLREYAWASGDDEARELAFETVWSLDEVLVATIKVLERHDAPWAARYFTLAHEALDTWHSRRRAGQPAGYLLFSDRRHSPQAHVTRQDNYHHLRALMLCLQSIDRIAGRPRSSGPAGR
ncbi:MAG: AGE family epimerase/isomerase [Vicinamibacteraceae bacterium]